jgi:hypothetical protein
VNNHGDLISIKPSLLCASVAFAFVLDCLELQQTHIFDRDARAIHLKLDEVIKSINQAQNEMIDPAIVRAVQPASLRSFFLADTLSFAHATDGSAEANGNVRRHGLQLSLDVSDTTTADESHAILCSFFRG